MQLSDQYLFNEKQIALTQGELNEEVTVRAKADRYNELRLLHLNQSLLCERLRDRYFLEGKETRSKFYSKGKQK